jgi:Protein of unknown function (DUF1329)
MPYHAYMKLKLLCLSILLLALPASLGAVEAGNPALTPLGAQAAGNVAGTIPPWTGGLPQKSIEEYGEITDPFGEDELLFTVNAANLGTYAEMLSEGQRAMLDKYPDSYHMPVYPSRRSASYPDYVYDALEANRQSAELISSDGRHGVRNSLVASPFPEPENGQEAIWNHMMRWRGILLERQTSWVPVTSSGRYRPILLQEEVAFPYASPDAATTTEAEPGQLTHIPEYRRAMIAVKQKFLSPGRVSGGGSLIYDTYDYTRYERIRWVYPASLKRVVRMPRAKLDQPITGTDGIIGLDDQDMYRGSPELFQWSLEPAREMLIPYNAYRLKDRTLRFDDLIGRHHLNQALTRYELHRVWRVTATAKPGSSSRYARRVFYLDEDSWQIVLSEKYDDDGNLSMFAESHTLNYYHVPVLFPGVSAHYSLADGRFLIQNIDNMLAPHRWLDEINPREFSPNALLDYIR